MSEPVLLDTSLLTAAVAAKVDIIGELRRIGCVGPLHIFAGTLRELENLRHKKTTQAPFAAIALRMLALWPVTVLEDTGTHVDADIIAYARTHDCVVGAQDKALRKKLHDLKRATLVVRQRSHLALEQPRGKT